jgi:hypothetical protein
LNDSQRLDLLLRYLHQNVLLPDFDAMPPPSFSSLFIDLAGLVRACGNRLDVSFSDQICQVLMDCLHEEEPVRRSIVMQIWIGTVLWHLIELLFKVALILIHFVQIQNILSLSTPFRKHRFLPNSYDPTLFIVFFFGFHPSFTPSVAIQIAGKCKRQRRDASQPKNGDCFIMRSSQFGCIGFISAVICDTR